jgi:hypothetical protein
VESWTTSEHTLLGAKEDESIKVSIQENLHPVTLAEDVQGI